MRLHGYFRSTASWRVRIALNLKGLRVDHLAHHLRRGEQRAGSYLALNPQGLVPTLETDGGVAMTQSLAICEWLDETYPSPSLLPGDALDRARIRGFAMAIACDVHPVQNLRVLARLRSVGVAEDEVTDWARWVIGDGLAACQRLLPSSAAAFCFGASPTLADLCLVPQLYNARRFGVDLAPFARLLAAEAACEALPAFAVAAPDRQYDAEPI
jgi:maleylpyruvate isomerase